MQRASFIHKFNRSQEHLHALDQAVKWWLGDEPYVVASEINAESGFKEVVITAQEQPPARFSLMAGDAIQNLRSTLDHLVVEIARVNSGGYLMERVERDIMFPITTSPQLFRNARKRGCLGCVPPRAQALIRLMQPYHNGDEWTRHPLWVLHQLSNIDKHRRLPLLQSTVPELQVAKIRFRQVREFSLGASGPFKDKAVLASWDPDAEVEVDLRAVTVEVAFGEGTPLPGAPLLQSLADLSQIIRETVMDPLLRFT